MIFSARSDISKPLKRAATVEVNPTRAKDEKFFDFLREFHTHFLIDDSLSMYGDDWNSVQQALLAAALYCTTNNISGFDVSFLHHQTPGPSSLTQGYRNVKSQKMVEHIFKNVRTSEWKTRPTGSRLKNLLNEHTTKLDHASPKQNESVQPEASLLKAIVITNGIPTDDISSALTLKEVQTQSESKEQDSSAGQISVEFWQVGRNGPTTHFLLKTGKLRSMPPTPNKDADHGLRWKYDPEDRRKAGPSRNFVKYMATNLLQSAFLRT